jgi:MFS transporter, DHA1 family, tetracycline resistance protein
VPSLLASLLAFSNLGIAYFRLPESRNKTGTTNHPFSIVDLASPLRKVISDRKLAPLFLTNFIGILAFTFLDVSLAPWLQRDFGFGSLQVGLIFFYTSIVNVLAQALLVPRLSKRMSTVSILLVGIAVLSLSYLGLGLLSYLPFLLITGGFLTLGFGLISPSINNLISVNSSEDEQGANLGVGQSMGFLAQALAPVIAATVFSFGLSIDFNGLVFVAAAVVNTVALGFVTTFRAREKIIQKPVPVSV